MAKLNYGVSPTSVILRVKLLNSSVTTGAGLAGLTSASAGLIIGTIKENEAATAAYTVTGATIETITTLGTYETPTATKCRFKEVDATNHPGIYEIHLADARFTTSKTLIISISGAANLAQCDVEVQCSTLDANIISQANIDFGALQKTSLNAATPASVQNISAQTGDSFARLGAPAGVSVSADVAAVKADSAAILIDTAVIGAAGAGLTALGDARLANLDTTVSSRLAPAGTLATVTALTNDAGITQAGADKVWGTSARSLTDKADFALSAAAIDAILDDPLEGALTLRQALRLFVSALAGKSSGGGTATLTFQDYADLKARITATVDANGNRTAITLDGT